MNRQTLTLIIGALALGPSCAAAQEVQEASLGALEALLDVEVSTASKYDQRQTDAPAFVSIVTRADIESYGFRSLEEVLQSQIGFYSGNDRDYSDIGVRGVGRPGYYNNKILLLVDGHALNDNFSGGTRIGGAMPIDLDVVERVEIVRGPGSSLYGARAMLAVVNMVTRKGRDIDGVVATLESGSGGAQGASVQYGRVLGPQTDLALSTSWGTQRGEDLYFPELDVPALNNGRAEGLDWEDRARALATLRAGNLLVQAALGRRSKGIPTAAYSTTFNHPSAKTSDQFGFVDASYEFSVSTNTDMSVRGYTDAIGNDGTYPFGPPDGSESVVNVESEVSARSFGGEARVDWRPSASQRIVFGLEGLDVYQADFATTSSATPGEGYPYTLLSGFIHQEFQLTEAFSLTLGVRRDQYSTIGRATTPRAALVFHGGSQGNTTLKLLAGGAFRAPNLLELYVTTPEAGLLSNPDLRPERIRTFELVWEQQIGRVAGTASVFHNEVNDLIELVEVELPLELREFGRLGFQQENISTVRARGFELDARAVLGTNSRARLGYTFVDAWNMTTGSPMLNSPRHQLRMQATTSLRHWVDLGVTVRADGRRGTLYGSQTDPTAVMDLTLTSTHWERLTVRASANNLFDRAYSVPGGFQHVQSVIPQPGRRITLRAQYHW